MCALGLTMLSRTKAGTLSPASFAALERSSSAGPTLPLAPALASAWQPPQPDVPLKTFSPAGEAFAAFFWPATHVA